MTVLFNVRYPSAWLKGGGMVLVRETQAALERLGVQVEWVDYASKEVQKANIIHYWGGPPSESMWRASQLLGMKRVVTYLGPSTAGTPDAKSYAQRMVRSCLLKTFGKDRLFGCMGIGIDRADAYFFQNDAERNHAIFMYGWNPDRCHAIPNGVSDIFFDEQVAPEKINALFYPAYICPRKNQVAVARAAKKQQIPVVFVGVDQGNYPEYFEQFKNEIDNKYVIWLGEIINQRRFAALYRGTLGTFLASEGENLPLVFPQSLACGRPVMCTKLPSVESFFGDRIQYCPAATDANFSGYLRAFYNYCQAGEKQQVDLFSWVDVGRKILDIYKSIDGITE